ncbi:odorant receptor 22c-like [Pseudomyrmex gracilis]|uniref:odorant receptor 22c-like n=1 Tax=Pseudomyrmex gracilis TaxID=219809 RepID=UPI0009957B90|nr:odorant receptor 22c-like [Pseudomyrmex gracilis]
MNVNKDLNYAFALSRQCLRLFGIWPDPHVSVSDIRRPSLRFIIITCIVSFYVFVPQVTNIIRAWGNVALMVEHFASANFSMIALCKLVVTWYHGETLQMLVTSVMTDWITSSNWERYTMMKIARCSRSLSYRCYFFGAGTVGFYFVFNLTKFYQFFHQPQRHFVYPIPYPYAQKSPNYEITFFIQLCAGVYTVFIICTVDSFVSTLVLHMCSQLINLRTTLQNLIDEIANKSMSSSKFRKNLSAIITRHELIIRNAKALDNCFSAMLFVHMLSLTFQLCFQTFRVFTIITEHLEVPFSKKCFLSCYVLLVVMLLWIYCYSAERLLEKSTGIAYGVYECKWYDLPSKNVKDLMFMIYRSADPLILTAGKFGTFSIEMFGITVKTSMGYLSVLLAMKD